MKNNMLVLLDHPEDIEDRLSELQEIAVKHKVAKVYLARVSRPFGSRVRSIVAPHKLDMAAKMSDESARGYLSRIADALGKSGISAEPVSTGILAAEIQEFINNNNFDLIVSTESLSRLFRRPESITGRQVQYL